MQLNVNDDYSIEDFSEDELRSEIGNLGADEFLILAGRPDDDEYYIQTYHNADGSWQLEYRDGSVDRHFGVDPGTITVADVTEAMVLYFHDPAAIVLKWDWEQVEFDENEVEYHGVMMSPDWPEKIETAQLIETITIDGTQYERIRYCHEAYRPTNREHICKDCGVLADQFHVPGCDFEECPRCNAQLLSCDCEVEEED